MKLKKLKWNEIVECNLFWVKIEIMTNRGRILEIKTKTTGVAIEFGIQGFTVCRYSFKKKIYKSEIFEQIFTD